MGSYHDEICFHYLNVFLPVGQMQRVIPVCLLPECLTCGTNTRGISSYHLPESLAACLTDVGGVSSVFSLMNDQGRFR